MTKKLMMMLVVALAAAMPLMAATETVGGYTWTYRINGDTAEVQGISPKPPGAVTIPSTLGGKPVTSIGESAFSGCSGLTSVTIPDSVTSIGWFAFSDCSGLTSVHITDLAAWCRISFENSSANPLCRAHNLYLNGSLVADLVLPDGMTSIGDWAFYGCRGLTGVTIPSSVTSIGEYAFSGCRGLTGVTIGNSVTNIGAAAFSSCKGLTSVIIPDSVTSIGRGAFCYCSSLADVAIGNGLTELITGYADGDSDDSGVFAKCANLTNVTFGSSMRIIGNYSFQDCARLANVIIPAQVTTVGTDAFYGCTKLWTAWYRTLANSSAAGGAIGGGSSGGGSVAPVDLRYALSASPADRAIASVTVNGDTALDGFVLTDGKVYDSVLYVVNTAATPVRLTLPVGHTYVTVSGLAPLLIPASSTNLVTVTRMAADTFLVTRQNLEAIK